VRPARRAPGLEEILYEPLPVLDHRFIRGDAAVVQAARVSYGRGTRKISEDQGLINYLIRHDHRPRLRCDIKYRVELPSPASRFGITPNGGKLPEGHSVRTYQHREADSRRRSDPMPVCAEGNVVGLQRKILRHLPGLVARSEAWGARSKPEEHLIASFARRKERPRPG
jgi:hypothetical protein